MIWPRWGLEVGRVSRCVPLSPRPCSRWSSRVAPVPGWEAGRGGAEGRRPAVLLTVAAAVPAARPAPVLPARVARPGQAVLWARAALPARAAPRGWVAKAAVVAMLARSAAAAPAGAAGCKGGGGPGRAGAPGAGGAGSPGPPGRGGGGGPPAARAGGAGGPRG